MATLIHLQVAAFVLENAHLDRMGCTELVQSFFFFIAVILFLCRVVCQLNSIPCNAGVVQVLETRHFIH